jgi:mannonate dehydratase
MKMIMRYFPYGDDSVTLQQIRQIPGVSGVATCLPKIPVGEVWTLDEVTALRRLINSEGLEMEVIESVNVHEDIKKGLPTRDRYLYNYIETIKNLAAVGVRCLCYNLMPVLDWARSELSRPMPDGTFVMSYRHEDIVKLDPTVVAGNILAGGGGYTMPGYEPERLAIMASDIEFYNNMSEDDYWSNVKYFLDAVVPAAEKYDVKLAIHPDDPPWSIFGLPRLINSAGNIRRFLSLYPGVYNGITLCAGSLGSDLSNDIPAMAREFGGRVHFAHVRNVKRSAKKDFVETAHYSPCGDLDLYAVMKALHDAKFDGYIRPDHGRMIWGEKARPGYGLYDRALGTQYLLGLWEAMEKS